MVYLVTPYFIACAVTITNSNHKFFNYFFDMRLWPHCEKGSATHVWRVICGRPFPLTHRHRRRGYRSECFTGVRAIEVLLLLKFKDF